MTVSTSNPGLTASLELRRARAALKRQVRANPPRSARGELAAIIDNLPTELDTMLIWDLLGWTPYLSDDRKRRILRNAGIHSPYRLVRELTERQLARLAIELRAAA